jgi:hypothetical protein
MAIIEGTGSLNILNLTGHSWVADWSEIPGGFHGTAARGCSGPSTADCSYIAPNVLVASGVTFDTVETVSDALPEDDGAILEAVKSVWLQGCIDTQAYPNGDSLEEACAWVLSDGQLDEYWPPSSSYPTVAEAKIPFQQLILGTSAQNSDPGAQLHKSNVLSRAVLFKTTMGYFGVSSRTVKLGDTVSVLLGCSLPTIFRRQSKDQHLFVGCSYIHGIMAGEVLLGPLPAGWKAISLGDGQSDFQQRFIDPARSTHMAEDPRMGPLPPDWSHVIGPDRAWPSKSVKVFRNSATGEILHSDPRMLPDALRATGVPQEKFALV